MVRQLPVDKVTLQVNGLGTAEGFLYPSGTAQFFGIPYGNLSKRWTRASLANSWKDSFHDGTKLGARAPTPTWRDMASSPFMPIRESHMTPALVSELECLNLNITIPPESAGPGPFPVLVWIHGGGFVFGGNDLPVYDGANLATFAAECGHPVVLVAINYRVGHGGFLSSFDIQKELHDNGFSGVGNFGLSDQVLALNWIQDYISEFYGDKENVTVYGESAGSISIAAHIASKNPPTFHRAICMSGPLATVRPWSIEDQELRYRKLLKKLNIPETDALEKLRAVSEADVADALNVFEKTLFPIVNPSFDGCYVPCVPAFGIPDSPPWLKSFMIGHVADEGVLFHDHALKYNFVDLHNRMREYLSETEVDHFMNVYGISSTSSDTQFRQAVMDIGGDWLFKFPNIHIVHRVQLPQTFAYRFDQPCHLDNPLKGLAYHSVELLSLFLNCTETMTPAQVRLSKQFAEGFLQFAYGKEPWKPVGKELNWKVFGPNGECAIRTEEEDKNTPLMKRAIAFGEAIREKYYEAVSKFIWETNLISSEDY